MDNVREEINDMLQGKQFHDKDNPQDQPPLPHDPQNPQKLPVPLKSSLKLQTINLEKKSSTVKFNTKMGNTREIRRMRTQQQSANPKLTQSTKMLGDIDYESPGR